MRDCYDWLLKQLNEQMLSTAIREELEQLPLDQLARINARLTWCKKARPEQLAPQGDWTTWMILTGRGWGKTRTGAEWVWWEASKDPNAIIGVFAPTFDMLRGVCFLGESGLLAVIPPELIAEYNKSLQNIRLTNGAQIQGFSAQEPDRIRGSQFTDCWLDELASWQYLTESLDNINFCLRLGKYPRRLITTTPKPLKAIRDLLLGSKTKVTSGSTYDNKANLPESFFNDIAAYVGTKIGQQEIEGQLIDWSDSGIFPRSWFHYFPAFETRKDGTLDRSKKKPFPKLSFIIQSYDTSFKIGQMNDPSAGTTWGVFKPEGSVNFSIMLLDCWSERLSYPDLREKLKLEFNSVYGPEDKPVDLVLIEDKASGQALIPDLQRAGIPVEAYTLPPDSDKIQRAHSVSHLAKRYVWIPESTRVGREGQPRDWAINCLDQIHNFGPETFKEMERLRRQSINAERLHHDATAHDDMVDTFVQALAWLRDSQWLRLPEDVTKEERDTPQEPIEQARTKEGVYG